MIQRFIELGNGYSDFYELMELAQRMPERVEQYLAIHSVGSDSTKTSLAIIMRKTEPGDFQPIYICLEGLPHPSVTPSKRYQQFEQLAEKQNHEVIELTVKSSAAFHDKSLYFQYVISILRLNRLIRPYF